MRPRTPAVHVDVGSAQHTNADIHEIQSILSDFRVQGISSSCRVLTVSQGDSEVGECGGEVAKDDRHERLL